MAAKLHILVKHLSKMENGHLMPSIDIVQRLIMVFTVSATGLNEEENTVIDIQNSQLNEQLAFD